MKIAVPLVCDNSMIPVRKSHPTVTTITSNDFVDSQVSTDNVLHGENSIIVLDVESEVEEESEAEDDEELEDKESPVVCELCGQAPCDWQLFSEEIWEDCNGLKEAGADNKAVRFHAYKMYTGLRHGILQCLIEDPCPCVSMVK
jgi:hypothetical protein